MTQDAAYLASLVAVIHMQRTASWLSRTDGATSPLLFKHSVIFVSTDPVFALEHPIPAFSSVVRVISSPTVTNAIKSTLFILCVRVVFALVRIVFFLTPRDICEHPLLIAGCTKSTSVMFSIGVTSRKFHNALVWFRLAHCTQLSERDFVIHVREAAAALGLLLRLLLPGRLGRCCRLLACAIGLAAQKL